MASEEAGVASEEEGGTEDPWLGRFDVDNSFPSGCFPRVFEGRYKKSAGTSDTHSRVVESEQSLGISGRCHMALSFCLNPWLSDTRD